MTSVTKQVVDYVRIICRVMNATHFLKHLLDIKTFRDRSCDYLVIETINVPDVSFSDKKKQLNELKKPESKNETWKICQCLLLLTRLRCITTVKMQ